jgi:transcriptional regulator with XRE-family HTH domain
MDHHAAFKRYPNLGELLRQQRLKLALTQAEVARGAKISASYLSALEGSKRLPPAQSALRRILDALECDADLIEEAEQIANAERGHAILDIDLPADTQALISDIRTYAAEFSPRFVRGLRQMIREVVSS